MTISKIAVYITLFLCFACESGKEVTPESLRGADRGMFVYDMKDRPALLVNNEWALGWVTDNNPTLQMYHVPPDKKEA